MPHTHNTPGAPFFGGPPIPDRGGLILGLAIGGVVCTGCAPLGLSIVALRMAMRDERLISSGQMNPDGRSLTIAGRICAIVGVCLGACSMLMLGVYAAFVVFAVSRS